MNRTWKFCKVLLQEPFVPNCCVTEYIEYAEKEFWRLFELKEIQKTKVGPKPDAKLE